MDAQLATAYTKADGTRAFTGDQSMGSHKITNLTDGSSNQDAATYGQLVALVNGFDQKGSVRVATAAAGTLATSFANTSVVDGVTLATGDHILIKDQASGSENGIYVVAASGAPTRRADADASAEVTGGFTVWVNEGTVNADTQWTLTTNDPITLNTTALVFTQTDKSALTFSGGLSKSGNAVVRSDFTGDVTTTGNGVATTIAANAVTYAKFQTVAANSLVGNATGSTATAAAVAMTPTATASTVMYRDANANVSANNYARGVATTATAAGTTTLTASSAQLQQFTGATTQTVTLPNATTLILGTSYIIANRSTGAVQVNMNGGGALITVPGGSQTTVTAINIGTTAGTWDAATPPGSGSGTVTTVSVVSANGFAGSVATSSTTPAITLTTTITGVLKGNGTAISAAAAGTDYIAPSGFITRETPTGTVNGSNATFTLANTPLSGAEQVYLNGLQQDPGAGNDYTISGATITMLNVPVPGDKLRVTYLK